MSRIRQVLQYYGVDATGDKICCPLHGEKTASFNIYDHNNTYYCFGGGKECGHSMVDFVILMEGLDLDKDFKEGKAKVLEILGESESEFDEERKRVTNSTPAVECLPSMDVEDVKKFIQSLHIQLNDGKKVHASQGLGYRGITDETLKFYGHLTRKDKDGNVLARFYPETNTMSRMAGYKCRNHPKDFTHGNVGHTGGKNQLSGQVKFTSRGKYLLIVGGEEDKCAAYQMLKDNRSATQTDYDSIAVVSPTCGESSAANQVAANFDFCDRFDIIRIGMDNDDAGRKAAEKIAAVLPKEKVEIVLWSGKDPNKMLEDGKEKQFCRDFWNAKPVVASGIQQSADLLGSAEDVLMRPRIGLPPHLHKLEAAMRGGIQQGSIVHIIGDTSVGKSTHVNGLVYHWMFNAPEKVGVVSLEATAGQYLIDMISLHLGKNLMWMGNGAQILEYLNKPEVKKQYDDLLVDEQGRSRFAILDERDGNIKTLEKQIEKLVHQYGCKIIVIDVLTDILRGSNADAQEDHMVWQKQMVKNGVTIINVLHTKKPPANPDGGFRKATEYDAFGSSSFVQSAAVNIVISRDKMNPCPIEKNKTHVDMPKCRGGETGEICQLIYDVETRQVMDFDDWTARQHQQRVNVYEEETPPQRDEPPVDDYADLVAQSNGQYVGQIHSPEPEDEPLYEAPPVEAGLMRAINDIEELFNGDRQPEQDEEDEPYDDEAPF